MSMNVSLGEMEEFVREKVARGEYRSMEEMLCEGLRLLQRRDDAWKARIGEKIEEGFVQARAGMLIPGEEVVARLEARLDEQEKTMGA